MGARSKEKREKLGKKKGNDIPPEQKGMMALPGSHGAKEEKTGEGSKRAELSSKHRERRKWKSRSTARYSKKGGEKTGKGARGQLRPKQQPKQKKHTHGIRRLPLILFGTVFTKRKEHDQLAGKLTNQRLGQKHRGNEHGSQKPTKKKGEKNKGGGQATSHIGKSLTLFSVSPSGPGVKATKTKRKGGEGQPEKEERGSGASRHRPRPTGGAGNWRNRRGLFAEKQRKKKRVEEGKSEENNDRDLQKPAANLEKKRVQWDKKRDGVMEGGARQKEKRK